MENIYKANQRKALDAQVVNAERALAAADYGSRAYRMAQTELAYLKNELKRF